MNPGIPAATPALEDMASGADMALTVVEPFFGREKSEKPLFLRSLPICELSSVDILEMMV